MENWISFDGLGIELSGISKYFTIFNVKIYWYGVLIAIGFLLAVILALRACKNFGFTKDDLLTYIIVGTPVAIIFARLYYVVFNWDKYSSNLFGIFEIREGGLAIYGGVIGIIAVALIMTRVKKQSVIKLFDLVLPYVLIGQAIGRWGNFINQEAYGRQTSLPWRMSGNDIMGGRVSVHPTFLYESLWCLLIFALIMIYSKKLRKNDGELMCLYLAGYGFGRIFIENLRTDSLYAFGLKVSLWLSVLLVLGFGTWFVYLRFFKKQTVTAADGLDVPDEIDVTEAASEETSEGEIIADEIADESGDETEEAESEEGETAVEKTVNEELGEEETTVEQTIEEASDNEEIADQSDGAE